MPYISKSKREFIDPALDSFKFMTFDSADIDIGTLNYIITRILLMTKPERYSDYNSLVGVLECVKLELYRRVVSEFEDKKKETNGDVY